MSEMIEKDEVLDTAPKPADLIEKTIRRVLDREGAYRLNAYMNTCVHCALCSDACHLYKSHDRHPRYAPAAKLKETLREIVKRKGRVDPDFLKNASTIAYTECTLCRRCSMYCPFGIDIPCLILMVRRICNLLGVYPEHLEDTVNNVLPESKQMRILPDEWIHTLDYQKEAIPGQMTTARIPFNKEGADIMYLVTGPEPRLFPQLIGMMCTIMSIAGLNWTIPSMNEWGNIDFSMFSGDFETMGRIGRSHYDTALKLGVKKIVMGECGHAFRAAVYDCPRWLGWKEPPVPVVHAIELYYDLISSGRLKIIRKFDEPVTVQDPCTIVRERRLSDKLRSIIKATCTDFRDVTPRAEHNYCCGAGDGAIYYGLPWKRTMVQTNKVKAEQLNTTGAKVVITPCYSCHSGIEDIIAFYKLNMVAKFFSEILMECIEIPNPVDAAS